MMNENEKSETLIYEYGRRQLDLLPGVLVKEDGRLYVRSVYFSNLHSQVDKLSMLMDVSRSIMAEISLDALLGKIIQSVTKVMNADRSTLFLVDAESGNLWSRVAQGASIIKVPMGEGIVGHVAKTGEIANIIDAYLDPRFNQEFDRKTGYRTKSILCMAIQNPKGQIIGAIQVLNKLNAESFEAGDEELLGAFSSLAGISLENARAYEELEKEKNSLEVKVQERTKDLEIAKKKSDELLLNILPSDVAEELKLKGHASTRRFEQATVLFTDFKGFTAVAETLSPELLIAELDKCFFYFDEIMERYGLEKIKTIGDSYMCAGGIPRENKTNPIDAILAALELQNFMNQMKDIKTAIGEPFWELRLGIHTGPLVAGVVGKHKFAYDIWGDTVNTASRMESSGEVGKVNISESTYQLVKDFFDCIYRGKVPAKNKGDINMYFVQGIKQDLSRDGKGSIPNEIFYQKLGSY